MSNNKEYLLLFFFLFININCNGRCGPDNYIPTESIDCTGFSNSTHACCFLHMLDSSANYQICYSMSLNEVAPIISNGKLTYLINCSAMENYTDYFPLESVYNPCGVAKPSSNKDCWPYSSDYGACCLVSDNDQYLGNPFCYYFPDDHFEKQNFTVDVNGKTFYVSCKENYIKLNNIFLYFIFILATLLF
jgi:hypothetical protein